jgi:hypothetical protein
MALIPFKFPFQHTDTHMIDPRIAIGTLSRCQLFIEFANDFVHARRPYAKEQDDDRPPKAHAIQNLTPHDEWR